MRNEILSTTAALALLLAAPMAVGSAQAAGADKTQSVESPKPQISADANAVRMDDNAVVVDDDADVVDADDDVVGTEPLAADRDNDELVEDEIQSRSEYETRESDAVEAKENFITGTTDTRPSTTVSPDATTTQ